MCKGPKYVLKIIELNEFKNLCHLAIEMTKASDADVAKNICKKMTTIKVNQDFWYLTSISNKMIYFCFRILLC